jgi:serine/threonine-protein kinase
VGDRIGGKYRLTRLLGRGGMGLVFEAVDERIGKAVAVKTLLLPEGEDRDELVARFQQEAQAASAAGHRGIVDIYDVGVEGTTPFLVMELLRGESLAELLAREGPLDVPRTAFITCQVLSALSAAHQAGVVHRDLKPENVYLAQSGAPLPEVKLLDFGISRVIPAGAAGRVTRMTKTGLVMGTPSFMSPEQAAGAKDIDHRTDLYSMAVILFQCVTGGLPHSADNYNALMVAIISEPPVSPLALRPDLPDALEAIIVRGLEKRREGRYASAAEMFYDLRPFVDAGAVAALRAPVSPRGAAAPLPTLREVREVREACEKPEAAAAAGGEISGEEPTVYGPDSVPTRAEPSSGAKGRAPDGAPPPWLGAVPETSRAAPRRGRGLVVAAAVALALVLGAVAAGFAISRGGGADDAAARPPVEPVPRAAPDPAPEANRLQDPAAAPTPAPPDARPASGPADAGPAPAPAPAGTRPRAKARHPEKADAAPPRGFREVDDLPAKTTKLREVD